jgi:hypothetical protein
MTIVKPERHFIELGRKMLCRNLMPRTNDPALERRERGFHAVFESIMAR